MIKKMYSMFFSGKSFLLIFFGTCFFLACKSNRGLFSSAKTAHERYSERIEKAGLQQTTLGRSWFGSAGRSLNQPVSIALPYAETGFFNAAEPRATGFRFNIRQGEKLVISVSTVPDTSLLFFAELWEMPAGKPVKMVAEADTAGMIVHESGKDGTYLVRLQPELLKSVQYTIRINTAPSLVFPVRVSDEPKISSFWGADRDGGIRKHEGVDIFAKKRTPLVAAASGRITRVGENNLGGKVIFMRPDDKAYSLYYAHLDSQLVQPGQDVTVGQVIGLMGNTGNARTTPAHLHFGIYTREGAVDPLPFIDRDRKLAPDPSARRENLNEYLRAASGTVVYSQPDAKSSVVQKITNATLVQVEGAGDQWYRVWVNDSIAGFTPEKQLSPAAWKRQEIGQTLPLYHNPAPDAPAVKTLEAGTKVEIIGRKGNYYLVDTPAGKGWIEDNLISNIK